MLFLHSYTKSHLYKIFAVASYISGRLFVKNTYLSFGHEVILINWHECSKILSLRFFSKYKYILYILDKYIFS